MQIVECKIRKNGKCLKNFEKNFMGGSLINRRHWNLYS